MKLGYFRFDHVYEIECGYSFKFQFAGFTSSQYANIIPEASFSTGTQHEEVRSLETSLLEVCCLKKTKKHMVSEEIYSSY